MPKKRISLLEMSKDYLENVRDLLSSLGTIDDERIVKQMKKILESDDDDKINTVIYFLNAFIGGSRKNSDLLKANFGDDLIRRLVDAGLKPWSENEQKERILKSIIDKIEKLSKLADEIAMNIKNKK